MANPGFPGTNVAYHVGIEFTANSGFMEVRDRVLSVVIGSRMGSPSEPWSAPTAEIKLDNSDGAYSPYTYSVGSYVGLRRPGLNVRVWGLYRTDSTYVGGINVSSCNVNSPPAGVTFYPLFTGAIDQWETRGEQPTETTLQCQDSTTRLALQKSVNIPIQTSIDARSLLSIVFSMSGFTSAQATTRNGGGQGSFDFAQAWDIFPVVYFEPDITTGDTINRIVEAGDYRVWTLGDGTITVGSRYVMEFLDLGGDAPLPDAYTALGPSVVLNADGVVNKARIVSNAREVGTSVVTLGFLSFPVTIQGSKFANFFLDYIEPETGEPCPATSLQTLVASTDYQATTNSFGTGIDRTSTLSVAVAFFATTLVATIFNGHSDTVYLNRFQARGVPLRRRSSIVSEYVDNSSQAFYGVRERTVVNDLLGTQAQADGLAQQLVFQYKDPFARYSMSGRNIWPKVLNTTLGTSITFISTLMGLPGSYSGPVLHSTRQFVTTAVEHVLEGESGVILHTVNFEAEETVETGFLILDGTFFQDIIERRLS